MSDPNNTIEINGERAFAILSQAYAEQTVELRVVRAQLAQAQQKIAALEQQNSAPAVEKKGSKKS